MGIAVVVVVAGGAGEGVLAGCYGARLKKSLRVLLPTGFILIAVGIVVFERRDLYAKVTPLNTKRTFIRSGSKIKLTPNLVIEMFETSTMRMVKQMARRTSRVRSVATQTMATVWMSRRSSLPPQRRGRFHDGPVSNRRRHSFDQYYYYRHLLRNDRNSENSRVSKRGGRRNKSCRVYGKRIAQQTEKLKYSLSISCPQLENIIQ